MLLNDPVQIPQAAWSNMDSNNSFLQSVFGSVTKYWLSNIHYIILITKSTTTRTLITSFWLIKN